MADLVRERERRQLQLPHQFLRGCACHQLIDAFTDTHPRTRADRRLIRPHLRRYSSILLDIFYDHALATSWPSLCPVSLEDFSDAFHQQAARELDAYPRCPPAAHELLDHLITTRRFLSYRSLDGIEDTLARLRRRLEKRWNRSIPLTDAIHDLATHKHTFTQTLDRLLPELIQHLHTRGYQITLQARMSLG
jgi:acyl carrier protein phosphodiesterase